MDFGRTYQIRFYLQSLETSLRRILSRLPTANFLLVSKPDWLYNGVVGGEKSVFTRTLLRIRTPKIIVFICWAWYVSDTFLLAKSGEFASYAWVATVNGKNSGNGKKIML